MRIFINILNIIITIDILNGRGLGNSNAIPTYYFFIVEFDCDSVDTRFDRRVGDSSTTINSADFCIDIALGNSVWSWKNHSTL